MDCCDILLTAGDAAEIHSLLRQHLPALAGAVPTLPASAGVSVENQTETPRPRRTFQKGGGNADKPRFTACWQDESYFGATENGCYSLPPFYRFAEDLSKDHHAFRTTLARSQKALAAGLLNPVFAFSCHPGTQGDDECEQSGFSSVGVKMGMIKVWCWFIPKECF